MIIRRSSIAVALLCAVLSLSAGAANNLGDFAPSAVVYGKFSTYRPSTGAAFTLAGTPALSVYKDNSTTQSTTGVTLTADFDSVTGLNHFAIDTSADGTFYSAGSYFDVVVTTGTVDSVSVVGSVVGSFTIDKTMALKPATAGRKLVVDSAGLADANTVKVGPTGSGTAQTARDIGASVLISSGTGTGQLSVTSGVIASNVTQFGGSAGTFASGRPEVNASHWGGTAVATARPLVDTVLISGDSGAADAVEAAYDDTAGSVPNHGILDQGTAASGSAAGTFVFRAGQSLADRANAGWTIQITGGTGVGQARACSAFTTSNDTCAVSPNWDTTPDNTSVYKAWATAPGTGGAGLDAAGVRAAVGLASANLDTQFSGVQSDTNDIQTRLPATLVSGRMDVSVGAMAANTMTAAAAASDLATELQTGLATASALSTASGNINDIETIANKLDSGLELDGSVYRFTINALEQAPVGGGGGATDWTSDERTAIKAVLGIPGSGPTPVDPSTGILDTIRDYVDTEVATLLSRMGTPSDLGGGATLAANNADIEAQTDDIGVAGAGLTAADDAVLAAVASLNNLSAAQIRDSISEDQGGGVGRGCIEAVLLAFAAGDISTTGNTTTWRDPSNGEVRITSVVTSNGNRTATISCPTY